MGKIYQVFFNLNRKLVNTLRVHSFIVCIRFCDSYGVKWVIMFHNEMKQLHDRQPDLAFLSLMPSLNKFQEISQDIATLSFPS